MSTNLHELESTSRPFSVKCALFSNKTFCGSLDSTGINKGSCLRINHFPEDNNYDTDSSEYILRIVRASSLFPILSNILLLLGGLCVGAGRIYSSRNNILLSAGILFVAAGLSNIIGIIVYISSNAGDPSDKKDENNKGSYGYGWSFYFGALSFIVAESVGVLAVNIYIEKNKETRCRARREFIKTTSPYSRIPSYRYRRRRSSSRSTDPSRETSPVGVKMGGGGGAGVGSGASFGMPMGGISMYALSRDTMKSGIAGYCSPERDSSFLQVHNCFQKDLKEGVNRRTTPV
ncbi:unnamed protein product [Oncorhynchus mykiss]|uniref:Voltage-dependent calcium channel gamma-4 subunit n=1 Tax=Oncorhynchus mykiss TaxID=8022 RepID=A0A060WE41_ONCMY|nr:unnamed protein product [Oncorhynchus mykiss]